MGNQTITLNNKLYLDASGTEAIINKIAENKKSTDESIKKIGDDIAGLKEKDEAHDGQIKELQDKAFTNISFKQDDATNKITVSFGTTNKKSDAEKPVEGQSFEIDTSAFVADGLLDDVKLVRIDKDNSDNKTAFDPQGNKIGLEVPGVAQPGMRYLIFTFKVVDRDKNGTTEYKENTIWLNVQDLFDDYDFETGYSDDTIKKYVTIVAEETSAGKGVQTVTYKLGSSDVFKKNMELVEGSYKKNPEDSESLMGIEKLNEELRSLQESVRKGAEAWPAIPIDPDSVSGYFDYKVNGSTGTDKIVGVGQKTPQP